MTRYILMVVARSLPVCLLFLCFSRVFVCNSHNTKNHAAIASRNEGLVHKMAELEGLRAAAESSGKTEDVAEHRKEIEKLKTEGETLAARMLR